MGSGVLYLVLLLRSGNPSKHWITECPWCLMVNVFLRLWEWKIWNHLKGMTRQQPSVTQHTHLRHARTWHLTFLHLSTAAALINGFTEMLTDDGWGFNLRKTGCVLLSGFLKTKFVFVSYYGNLIYSILYETNTVISVSQTWLLLLLKVLLEQRMTKH